MARSALRQAVKKAQPHLSESEVDALLDRAARQEKDLIQKHGLNADQARELLREDLFGSDPWVGDEDYGPL